MAVRPQDRRQQRPGPAADVGHGPHPGEVIASSDGRGDRPGALGHGGLESLRLLRVPGEELMDGHSAGDAETRLAGPDRLDDRLERPDPAKDIDQHRPGPHRGRHAGAQPLAQHRQAERAIILLGQHAQRRQQPQHPVQRWLMRLRGPGQLAGAHRAACQVVRDAQLGCHVDSPRDVDARDHPQDRSRRRTLFRGRLRTAGFPARSGRPGRHYCCSWAVPSPALPQYYMPAYWAIQAGRKHGRCPCCTHLRASSQAGSLLPTHRRRRPKTSTMNTTPASAAIAASRDATRLRPPARPCAGSAITPDRPGT